MRGDAVTNQACESEVIRFDAESWVVVHLRPHSDVVQVTSNIADEEVAKM